MKPVKVLILYNYLFKYRIPIFRLLAEKCDLTVAYCLGPDTKEDLNFKVRRFEPVYKKGRFVIPKENVYSYCKEFDVVIAYADIAWLKYSTLPWHRSRNFKVVFWAIGVSASYDKGFDCKKSWDKVRDFFYKKADAIIYYSEYPIRKNLKRGYDKEKMFVAPNTVSVLNSDEKIEKDSILFIGTLYRQKGLDCLLEAYKAAYIQKSDIPTLNIVGGGNEAESIKEWIASNNLQDKIIMCGPIYDESIKCRYFRRAYACISPSQAGLSVLESMGYGVPFITSENAITGGEIFNIEDGKNGILMKPGTELSSIIMDVSKNPDKYVQMGVSAREHYNKYRKPSDMVNGLHSAITFTLQK